MITVDGGDILTAGVILRHAERYVFQAGFNSERDALGIVRLGGHMESGEAPTGCALREVAEEATVAAKLVSAPATFSYDPEDPELLLSPARWTLGGPLPLLSVRIPEAPHVAWSVTYLATASGRPVPAAETQALVSLTRDDVLWLTNDTVSLRSFLEAGGSATFAVDLPLDLPLRPFGQLRALAMLIGSGLL